MLNQKEMSRYNFHNVLMAAMAQRGIISDSKAQFLAGYELEISQELQRQSGFKAVRGGVMVPFQIFSTRALSAGTATAGAELVGTDHRPQDFIDVLRARSSVMSLGARTLTGLVGNVGIPRKTSGATASWISTEGGDAANSEPAFDTVSMSPKTLGSHAGATRQLLVQGSPEVVNLIKQDLMAGIANAVDQAALYGTGSNGQPTGIANQTGINAPTAFAGAVPTFAEIVAMESAVAVDNADSGALGYLFDPTTRGALKAQEKVSGSGIFCWESGELPVNGHRSFWSSNVVAGDVFFGNWSDLLIGMWGGVEILVDPYTNALSGGIRIVALSSIDIAVRHPVSFAFNNDGV